MSSYFHKASEIEKAFAEGYVGQAANMKWWESNMVPTHTNGARDDTTPIVDATSITNGDETLTTTGQGSDENYKAGDVFTIADVYDVNQETKQAYSHLKQWVVTADKTADGSDELAISPPIYKSGARQNCYCSSWTGNKAIVNVAAGGSGAASKTYTQNLAYHRDAFTFVSADLHIEPGQRMSRAVIEGISLRLWRGSDIVNDKFPSRIDVLYGYKTLRPEWAVRVRG
jgi:hypothetical protein